MCILFIIASLLVFTYIGASSFQMKQELTPSEYPDLYLSPNVSDEVNSIKQEGVNQGRYLFYYKRLSFDGTVSSASCHKQQLVLLDDRAFGIGVNGDTLRRTPNPCIIWFGMNYSFGMESLRI